MPHIQDNSNHVCLQVEPEPLHSLAEGLFLGPFLVLVAQVSTDSKPVRNAAEKRDLPWLAGLDEGTLRLMAELGGEDLVVFCIGYKSASRIR